MTKKDFELIADAIARDPIPAGYSMAGRVIERVRLAKALANALATTNPKFDRARFLAACGVQS